MRKQFEVMGKNLVNKNVLSCLLKDGREVDAVTQMLTIERVEEGGGHYAMKHRTICDEIEINIVSHRC